jgi:hypothetical protein
MWTLKGLAAVCYEQGLSDTPRSCPTMLDAIVRLGVRWPRAKHWIVSPDPSYERKKKRRDRLIQMAAKHPDLVLGFEDAVWWSRETQPALHAWSDDKPVRLVEKTVPAKDPGGKAVACYGLYVPTAHQMLWRFVQGRPRQQGHVRLSGVARHILYGPGQPGPRAHLGQGRLARQPDGAGADHRLPSPSQTQWRLSYHGLSVTEQESLAQSH